MKQNKKKPYLFTALILLLGISPLFAAEMTTGEKSAKTPVAANASTPQAVLKLDVLSQQADANVSTPQAVLKLDVLSQQAAANASTPQAVLKLDVLSQRAAANASTQEKHSGNRLSRIPAIMVRGAFDALSAPAEFIYTPMHESKEHPRLWPVTSVTRTATHVFYRLGSAVYDIAFYPFVAPFVDETPPLTEKMGLSADVWEDEDEY